MKITIISIGGYGSHSFGASVRSFEEKSLFEIVKELLGTDLYNDEIYKNGHLKESSKDVKIFSAETTMGIVNIVFVLMEDQN